MTAYTYAPLPLLLGGLQGLAAAILHTERHAAFTEAIADNVVLYARRP